MYSIWIFFFFVKQNKTFTFHLKIQSRRKSVCYLSGRKSHEFCSTWRLFICFDAASVTALPALAVVTCSHLWYNSCAARILNPSDSQLLICCLAVIIAVECLLKVCGFCELRLNLANVPEQKYNSWKFFLLSVEPDIIPFCKTLLWCLLSKKGFYL